jgi:hypothetical protein
MTAHQIYNIGLVSPVCFEFSKRGELDVDQPSSWAPDFASPASRAGPIRISATGFRAGSALMPNATAAMDVMSSVHLHFFLSYVKLPFDRPSE